MPFIQGNVLHVLEPLFLPVFPPKFFIYYISLFLPGAGCGLVLISISDFFFLFLPVTAALDLLEPLLLHRDEEGESNLEEQLPLRDTLMLVHIMATRGGLFHSASRAQVCLICLFFHIFFIFAATRFGLFNSASRAQVCVFVRERECV
jgi:integral membrane sensor domain MASE1